MNVEIVAVLRLEGMRGPERIVDGRRGRAFPGVVLGPSLEHSDRHPLTAAAASPLEGEWRIWKSVVKSLKVAVEGADRGAPIFFSGKAREAVVIEANPQDRTLTLRAPSLVPASHDARLPWPAQGAWGEAQSASARQFTQLLLSDEACGRVHAQVRGVAESFAASLVLGLRDPRSHHDDWAQLQVDLARMNFSAPSSAAEGSHGVHRALSSLALLARPSQPLKDLIQVESAAEQTFGLRSPCDAVGLQEVVGLAQQGGFAAKILRHFSEQGRHVHKWQRQRVSMTPHGIESCVCGEEADPSVEDEPPARGRAVCARASAAWDAADRRFGPADVRERARC